jgi:hypothetical protein
MWIVLAVVCVVLALGALAWRLSVIGRRTPTDLEPERQHEVPGAGAPAPGSGRDRPGDSPGPPT